MVDKRRLIRCPRPSPTLSLAHLSLLPLCGISAHRALRSSDLVQKGARALVLQGQEGAGAFALQELASLGVRVTAQIPFQKDTEDDEVTRKTEARVRSWGASEVLVDYPVAAIESLPDNEFDLVIDTVGGRNVWDTCRRVLRSTGQFTTLVGDSAEEVPSANAQLRSNFRSLARAFVKKDRKAIGYAWISPGLDVDSDGADLRDSLDVITKLAVQGVLVPWTDPERCVTFERAPTVFTSGGKVILKEGRTAVVQVVN